MTRIRPVENREYRIRVGNHGSNSYEYTVRAGRRAFYIKNRLRDLSGFKISLHCPDPAANLNEYYFKWGIDDSVAQEIVNKARILADFSGFAMPVEFAGRLVQPGVRHVVKLRVPWDMVDGRLASPPSKSIKGRDKPFALAPPAPRTGRCMEIDFWISHAQGYFPSFKSALRRNANLGPLDCGSGDFLTAVPNEKWMPRLENLPIMPKPGDMGRGVRVTFEDGVLTLTEMWMSAKALGGGELPAQWQKSRLPNDR